MLSDVDFTVALALCKRYADIVLMLCEWSTIWEQRLVANDEWIKIKNFEETSKFVDSNLLWGYVSHEMLQA